MLHIPEPDHHQVLIRLASASLNYGDLIIQQDIVSNRAGLIPLSDGIRIVAGVGVLRYRVRNKQTASVLTFFPDWKGSRFSLSNLQGLLGMDRPMVKCRLNSQQCYDDHWRKITLALTPPNPKPLDMACSITIFLDAALTISTPSEAISGFSKFRVAGTI